MAFDDDDVALVYKRVGDGDRGLEAASRVVPRIEDGADQLAADLLPQVLHRGGERGLGSAVKPGDAQIADVSAFDAPDHRLELVGLALE